MARSFFSSFIFFLDVSVFALPFYEEAVEAVLMSFFLAA